jgi:integrase
MPSANGASDVATRTAPWLRRGRSRSWHRWPDRCGGAPRTLPRLPIGARTLEALLKWKSESKDTSPDALIFPSTNKNGRSRTGAPMYPSTWPQKKLQPIADDLGIPFKVNFRATRRTASSLVQGHGAALATAQSLLRHASPHTTTAVYSKPIPDSVKAAVNGCEDPVYASRPKPPTLKRVK